jgi:predicted transcriptional regulator
VRIVSLHLSDTEYEQLQALALASDRTVTDVIHESIREYLHHKSSQDEFRDALERANHEHSDLIAELAEL